MNKKQENFKRLAESRTNKVIDLLQLIGNLSNTSNYEYSIEDVNKMFEAIFLEAERQKAKFKVSTGERKKRFKL